MTVILCVWFGSDGRLFATVFPSTKVALPESVSTRLSNALPRASAVQDRKEFWWCKGEAKGKMEWKKGARRTYSRMISAFLRLFGQGEKRATLTQHFLEKGKHLG